MVTVEITKAAPHHLVADGPVLDVRRTRSGDAWEARQGGRPSRPESRSGCPSIGVAAADAGLQLMAADAPTILATSGGIVYGRAPGGRSGR